MSNAHDYLADIERLGAERFAATGLAAGHSHVTRRVRTHRAVKASATVVASIGVVGGGSWGALMAFGSSTDEGVPGATASGSAIPTPPTDAATLTFTEVSFTTGDTLDAWVADTAIVLGMDEHALLGAIATAAPGDAYPEGWIKPGSYTLAPDASPEETARSLVAQRVAQLETLGVPRDQWQEVLTQASLVEAETPLASDMPKVARVIQNRLNQGIYLQLDSTVKYAVGDNGGVFLTIEDRETDSPYNTYLYAGLPPSAVRSPSDAAIDAVLNPAEGDWLYFVTANLSTGETLFATTYGEHLTDVEQLRAWVAAQE